MFILGIGKSLKRLGLLWPMLLLINFPSFAITHLMLNLFCRLLLSLGQFLPMPLIKAVVIMICAKLKNHPLTELLEVLCPLLHMLPADALPICTILDLLRPLLG